MQVHFSMHQSDALALASVLAGQRAQKALFAKVVNQINKAVKNGGKVVKRRRRKAAAQAESGQ